MQHVRVMVYGFCALVDGQQNSGLFVLYYSITLSKYPTRRLLSLRVKWLRPVDSQRLDNFGNSEQTITVSVVRVSYGFVFFQFVA